MNNYGSASGESGHQDIHDKEMRKKEAYYKKMKNSEYHLMDRDTKKPIAKHATIEAAYKDKYDRNPTDLDKHYVVIKEHQQKHWKQD